MVLFGRCCGMDAVYLYALRQRSMAEEETNPTPENYA